MGGSLEAMWGTRRFVTFYFATSALAALATAIVGRIAGDAVARQMYSGNGPVLEALVAAFAVLLPTATIFLIVLPIQARLLLPLFVLGVVFIARYRPWWIAAILCLFLLTLLAGTLWHRAHNLCYRPERPAKRSTHLQTGTHRAGHHYRRGIRDTGGF